MVLDVEVGLVDDVDVGLVDEDEDEAGLVLLELGPLGVVLPVEPPQEKTAGPGMV